MWNRPAGGVPRPRVTSLPSGTTCPRCGSPLYWTRDKTTEYCKAPDRANPLRTCSFALSRTLTERRWLLALRV
jgi:hypothetical protein